MSLNLRDPAGATAKRQVDQRFRLHYFRAEALVSPMVHTLWTLRERQRRPRVSAEPHADVIRAARGADVAIFALAGIRELITVAAQEIDSSPVKLCDPAVTMDPVDFTRTEKIGPTAPEAAGHPDDRRRLVDIASFPSVLAISIR